MISRLAGWWRTHRRAALAAAAVAGALVIAAAFIWPVTDLIAAHDVGRVAGPQRATQLQAAREAVRTQLLTLAAGVFVAGALWFTAQNFRLSRQGQVTDRYTKAIEQLGSDKLDVRIGAIYGLERIARDSATDHPTVMEVLAAFIREHSREGEPDDYDWMRGPRPDVYAAVTVIGRRNPRHDRQPVNLEGANLAGANLAQINLAGAILTNTNLSHATLIEANLTDAFLPFAGLASAWLSGADLSRANLSIADLTGALLAGGSQYRDADLTDAHLTDANLADAQLGEGQPVPEGWLRDPDSGRLRRSGPAADDS